MISILILDNRIEEAHILEEELRLLTAQRSDEQLSFVKLRGINELPECLERMNLLHAALVDVTVREGIKAARILRERYPQVQLLVISENHISPLSYLIPSIRPGALLLRPFEKVRTRETLEDFLCLFMSPAEEDDEIFWVKTRDGTQRIPYPSILYFEAREKKVFIRTRKLEYGIGGTLDGFSGQLPASFIRCHRSYIINRKYLERIRLSEGYACLSGQIMIPVSRTYKAQLKEVINVGKTP